MADELILTGGEYAEFTRIVIEQLIILKLACDKFRVGNRSLLSGIKGYSAYNTQTANQHYSEAKLTLYKEDFVVLAEAMRCFRTFVEDGRYKGAVEESRWEKFLEAADYLEGIIPEEYKKAPARKR